MHTNVLIDCKSYRLKYGTVTIPYERMQNVDTHQAGRVLYCIVHTLTRDLGFSLVNHERLGRKKLVRIGPQYTFCSYKATKCSGSSVENGIQISRVTANVI